MITNLKERLKQISSNCHSNNNSYNVHVINQNSQQTPRGNLGGKVFTCEFGKYVCKTIHHCFDSFYGSNMLGDILEVQSVNEVPWTNLEVDSIRPNELLFLDIETTGLSGGAGTVAFIIGLGYVEKKSIIIEQYIMRDFDEERAVLHAVLKAMEHYKILVTFNGKSFDWPLLESRMQLNRINPMDWSGRHVDLLHISRRIWKYKFESCSLTSLENNVLGIARSNDIPGAMIPAIYYDYLRTRDSSQMAQVLNHNEQDILALAALYIKLSKIYSDIYDSSLDEYELLSKARLYEEKNNFEKSVSYYFQCIKCSRSRWVSLEAQKRLGLMYKRHKRYEDAMNIWAVMAEKKDSLKVHPLIEMAKYYEHTAKDFNKALECVNKALHVLSKDSQTHYTKEKMKAVIHRRNRLIRRKG